VELGFTKDDVRRCAQTLGLTVWDKPASACLSSRIPYGTEVTRERLAQIGGLEAELRQPGLKTAASALAPRRDARRHGPHRSGRDELGHAFEVREAMVQAGKRSASPS